MTRNNGTILEKFIHGLSWPVSESNDKRSYVRTEKNSFIVKFLHAISYSQHELTIVQAKKISDPILEELVNRVGKLWDKAHGAMKEGKYIVARNALIKITAIDGRNAAAYNRLGIVYARRGEWLLSISCFGLAVKFENSAAANHNLGLIYYETENYKQSLKFLNRAYQLEPDVASRHVALAKVYEKLDKGSKVIEHLEKAYELDSSSRVLKLLELGYSEYGKTKPTEYRFRTIYRKVEMDAKNFDRKPELHELPTMDDLGLKYQYR